MLLASILLDRTGVLLDTEVVEVLLELLEWSANKSNERFNTQVSTPVMNDKREIVKTPKTS